MRSVWFFNCWGLMLCFAHTWQFVQCWYTDFFMPFQWYLFFKDAYVLLNPLWSCLSCARIRRQSLKTSGTTMGVHNRPFSTSFHFNMLFSIMYIFWSKFLFSHCFLSCLVCGSLSCNLASLSSFRGSWISLVYFYRICVLNAYVAYFTCYYFFQDLCCYWWQFFERKISKLLAFLFWLEPDVFIHFYKSR